MLRADCAHKMVARQHGRDFILLSLETRIVGRDALGIFESVGQRIVALFESFAIQELRALALVGRIITTIDEPFAQRSGVVISGGRRRRNHQIPARKRERGSVAGVHRH